MNKIKYYIVYLFITHFGVSLDAQEHNSPHSVYYPDSNAPFPYIEPFKVGVDTAKLSIIRNELLEWLHAGDIVNGELLILKGEQTLLHETYGWRIKEDNEPLEKNTLWWLRSHTKTITATVILLLEHEGKIALKDKITAYYPNYGGYPETTIEDLLAHRSGITLHNDDDNIERYQSLEEYAEKVAAQNVQGKYGEYGYDNMGYVILGGIAEMVLDRSIEEYIKENILQKLQMKDTYTNRLTTEEFSNRYNTDYFLHPFSQECYVRRTHRVGPLPFFMAFSGIISTVTDYAKFLTCFKNNGMWQGKRIFPEDMVKRMLTIYGFAHRNPFDVGFGYGWWVNVDHDKPDQILNFGHEGGDQALSYVYPQDDLTILFHGSTGGVNVTRSVRSLIAQAKLVKDHYSKINTVSAREFMDQFKDLSNEESLNYTGNYLGPEIRKNLQPMIQIVLEKGRLKANITELGRVKKNQVDLFYLGDSRFKDGRYYNGKPDWVSSDIVFKFNLSKAKPKSLSMMAGGQTIMAFKAISNDSLALKTKEIKKKRLIDNVVKELLKSKDIEEVKKMAHKLYQSKPDTVFFNERRLNSLGHIFLQLNKYNEAITVFEINAEWYPRSPNCFDSLAEAWKQSGNLIKAKEFYQRALDLSSEQNHSISGTIEKKLIDINALILNKHKN